MKRFFAIIMAAAMLCMMAIPSLAADDLLFYFKMDGDFGKDECGNATTTVLGEIEEIEGKVGTAACFDGVETGIWVESTLENQDVITMTCWSYVDFFNYNSIAISEWEEEGDFCFEYTNNGVIEFNNNGTDAWHTGTAQLVEGEWTYFTYVFDNVNRYTEIYVNGELDSRVDYPEEKNMGQISFDEWCIGGFFWNGKRPQNGDPIERVLCGGIDDLRVYNRALSQAEIKELMTTGELTASVVEETAEEPVAEETVAEPVAEETAAESTAEETVVEEPVVEAAAEEVVEADTAPQTFDTAVITLFSVIITAAACTVTRKRKS